MAIYEILFLGAASSRDDAMIAIKRLFFRGWKPLPREIDVNMMTLTLDLLKFHTRKAIREILKLVLNISKVGVGSILGHFAFCRLG
jgi:hypothetical protein